MAACYHNRLPLRDYKYLQLQASHLSAFQVVGMDSRLSAKDEVSDLRAQHAEKVATSLLLKEYPAENKKALIQ